MASHSNENLSNECVYMLTALKCESIFIKTQKWKEILQIEIYIYIFCLSTMYCSHSYNIFFKLKTISSKHDAQEIHKRGQ